MNEIVHQNSFIQSFIDVFYGLEKKQQDEIINNLKNISLKQECNINQEIFISPGGTGFYYTRFIDLDDEKYGTGFTIENAIKALKCQY